MLDGSGKTLVICGCVALALVVSLYLGAYVAAGGGPRVEKRECKTGDSIELIHHPAQIDVYGVATDGPLSTFYLDADGKITHVVVGDGLLGTRGTSFPSLEDFHSEVRGGFCWVAKAVDLYHSHRPLDFELTRDKAQHI